MKSKAFSRRDIYLGKVCLPYFFGSGVETCLLGVLGSLSPSKLFLVVDDAIEADFTARYIEALNSNYELHVYHCNANEKTKSPERLAEILRWGVAHGVDRKSIVLAMGGGVVGNIAGLAAHLFYRGIRLVHIPTTYIAAFDSVLSEKQAVNIDGTKNSIGGYLAASAIVCDVDVFASLGERERRNGMVEVIKNALIACPDEIPQLLSLPVNIMDYSVKEYAYLWSSSLDAKCPYLELDSKEKSSAIIFEYGHTLGHAIEAASCGEIMHGEAVAIGMVGAARIANQLGVLGPQDVALHESLLTFFGLSLSIPNYISDQDIERHLLKDNKRGYLPAKQNSSVFVLLEKLAQPVEDSQMPLTYVPLRLVREIICGLRI